MRATTNLHQCKQNVLFVHFLLLFSLAAHILLLVVLQVFYSRILLVLQIMQRAQENSVIALK